MHRSWLRTTLIVATLTLPSAAERPRFVESRREVGLDGLAASRLVAADLNRDGLADLMVRTISNDAASPRIFLLEKDDTAPLGVRYREKADTGLPLLAPADLITFADLDNDGIADAVVSRNLDFQQDGFQAPQTPPARSAWCKGVGDGSFGPPQEFAEALRGTTVSVAVGDVNRDGLPDVWFGNSYEKYPAGTEAFSNDLLLQFPNPDGTPGFVRWSVPGESEPPDPQRDPRGRPSYGLVIATLDEAPLPYLWELNYGRRWDRLYQLQPGHGAPRTGAAEAPIFAREQALRSLLGNDIAPAAGVDGDAIRHGRYPPWLAERAKTDPRFARNDEPPFRSNGNSFDGAVGDIDNDGDFDLFISTIYHAWAGESSDRSRFLVNRLAGSGTLSFDSPALLSVDRLPPNPAPGDPLGDIHTQQNQGDIFCELADLDHDGRLDLIICSSDYPDAPPYEERLRVFLQQPDGRFHDATADLGLDQPGAGQPALMDLDGDGALDLVVGQTFNRFDPPHRRAAGLANRTVLPDATGDEGAEPRLHAHLNRLTEDRKSLILRLGGDPSQGTSRDAFGAIVRMWADVDGDPATPPSLQIRQLTGPGGHAGKRHDSIIHFGLGKATRAERMDIIWPNSDRTTRTIHHLAAGSHRIDMAAENPPMVSGRFAAELTRFATDDPATGGIVFTGSSSIRRWPDLQGDFPGLPVVNRGFGGCHITDVHDRFEMVIARHEPKLLVIYAGANDIAEGKSVQQTFDATVALIRQSRARFPNLRILFLSLKIPPSRDHLAPQFHDLNRRLAAWSADKEWLRWIDAGTCLVSNSGKPDPAVFDEDRLHLNPTGYARWQQVLDPILRSEWDKADP